MTHKLYPQPRRAPGIPFFFERENAQEQVIIARELISATRSRSPDLRRNILNGLRLPVVEPALVRGSVCLYRVSKATIEPGEIHADDCIRLTFQRQTVKPVKQAPKFKIVLDRVGQADHRVLGHIES